MIKFDDIAETVMSNFYGGEGDTVARMFIDDKNRIMKIRLAPGASIGTHRHETSSEIIFVLNGKARAVLEGKEENVSAGECHYCRKGEEHSFTNIGDEELVFFAVVPQQ